MDGIKSIPGVHPYQGGGGQARDRKKKEGDRGNPAAEDNRPSSQEEERAHTIIPTSLISSPLPIFEEMDGDSLEPQLHEPVANAVHHYEEPLQAPVPDEVKPGPPDPVGIEEDRIIPPFANTEDAGATDLLALEKVLALLETMVAADRFNAKSIDLLYAQMEQARLMAERAVEDASQKMLDMAEEKAALYLEQMAGHLRDMEAEAAAFSETRAEMDAMDQVQDLFIAAARRVQAVRVKALLDCPGVFSLPERDEVEEAVARLPHIREG